MIPLSQREINKLKASPIFNCSLSSKELFHSNFLYWLCHTYNKELGQLFVDCLNLRTPSSKITNPERENKNLDIKFQLGNKLLVIENKVKSIPSLAQLEKYETLFSNNNEVKLVLLSLSKPAFKLKNWEYLSYTKYIEKIITPLNRQIKNSYHKRIISDYIDLITFLTKTLKPIAQKADIVKLHKSPKKELLDDLRLADVFQKLAYENFSNKLKANAVSFSKKYGKEIEIGSGLTNTQGLVSMHILIKNVKFGVQIQGEQYRAYIETIDKSRSQVQKITQRLLKDGAWFNLSPLKTLSGIFPFDNSKFNKFDSPKKNIFFKYRYVKLHEACTSEKELMMLLIKDLKYLLQNQNKLAKYC